MKLDKLLMLHIGRQTDNKMMPADIDISEYVKRWPSATFSIIVKRPGETTEYPADTTVTNGHIIWNVKNSDVAIPGRGKARIVAKQGTDQVWNSHDFVVEVGKTDSANAVNPPAAAQGWVDTVLGYKTAAAASAASAAASAAAAAASASSAQGVGSAVAYDDTEVRQLIAGKANANHTHSYDSLTDKPTLVTSYNQLTDKPSIPSAYDDTAVRGLIDSLDEGKSDADHVHTWDEIAERPSIPSAYDDTEIRGAVSQLNEDYTAVITLLGQVKTALENGQIEEAISLLDTFLLDSGVLE